MRKVLTIVIAFFLLCTSAAFAQSLTASVNKTNATCPSDGTITVTASGGTAPYQYSIIAGPMTTSFQTNNIFTGLVPGNYSVRVKDDVGATFDVNNISITTTYITMNPTATAITESCPGSNGGAIKLSFTVGQGTPPYSYAISADGGNSFTTVSTGNASTNYTFSNLAPGNYTVRVVDQCNDYQSRQATVVAGILYTNVVRLWARPSNCNETDYYILTSHTLHFPQKIYAYPNGDLNATPFVLTINAPTERVPVPGVPSIQAYKFPLPNSATFPNTAAYTFKFTDACLTDVTSNRVIPSTIGIGSFTPSTLYNNNCDIDIQVKVGEGWKMPVTVKVSLAGVETTQSTSNETDRTVLFSSMPAGTYTVTVTDDCGRTSTKTFNHNLPTLSYVVSTVCSNELPGLTRLRIDGLRVGTITTINSGPATYTDPIFNKTFTATYPMADTLGGTSFLQFYNLAPGTYNITITDANGCNSKTFDYVVQNNFAQFSIAPFAVGGCAGARYITTNATSVCAGPTQFYVDLLRMSDNTIVPNGIRQIGGPQTFTNLPADTYIAKYYTTYSFNSSTYQKISLFKADNADKYKNTFLLKSDTIAVANISSTPTIVGASTAKCADGSIAVKLIPSTTSSTITKYQRQNADGSYGAWQTSPIFVVPSYGTYNFRVEDECLNAANSAVPIVANSTPVVKPNGNTCLGGDIILTVDLPDNATAQWTKPNNATVDGYQLLIPNASAVDKGIYTVDVTYTIGTCVEVKTYSFSVDDCVSLSVDWGTFAAVIKNNKLIVDWVTLKEENCKYFEIQVSQDGKTWKPIGKVSSAAKNGNSDIETKYQFQEDISNIITQVGMPALLGLLFWGFRRKGRHIKVFLLAIAIFSCFAYPGCKKNKDAINIDHAAKVWIRIVQVDNDGTQKISRVFHAIRE